LVGSIFDPDANGLNPSKSFVVSLFVSSVVPASCQKVMTVDVFATQ
jgi:hypothetical protein